MVRADNSTQHIEWFFGNLVAKLTNNKIERDKNMHIVYLVPVYGGLWKLCTNLTAGQRATLLNYTYTYPQCINYLPETEEEKETNDWMTRMQNLAISCAIVCLILLTCAVLVGTFAIGRKQTSAVLVTAVMYILAGMLFCPRRSVFCVN
uniref:Uncharacterized protein n=1 Tax=Strigamia maritima TaxID=126957 RepID=T1IXT7_STRMM